MPYPTSRQTPEPSDAATRRNFALGVANGSLVQMGMGFIHTHLVLAAFMHELTGSMVLVGLLATLTPAGVFLPQLYASSLMEHRGRKKPFYVASVVARVILLAAMAGLMWVAGTRPETVWLVAFFVVFLAFRLAQGYGYPPFMDMVGQTIPARRLGDFFAMRTFLGQGLALLAGFFIVQRLISGLSFPANYAVLGLVAVLVMGSGWGVWCFAHESENPAPPKPRNYARTITDGASLLRHDRDYLLVLVLRLVVRVNLLMLAFFVPYGVERLGAKGIGGVFVGVVAGSRLASSLLWGRLSRLKGNRACLVGVGVLFALSPLTALVAPHVPAVFSVKVESLSLTLDLPLCVYLVSLCMIGLAFAGDGIGTSAFLLESAPPERRPSYIAFINTAALPATALPLVAGALVDSGVLSMEALLGAAVVGGTASTLAALRLTNGANADRRAIPAQPGQ